MFTTWGAAFSAMGISAPNATPAELAQNINTVVMDPTSGTADCWNTYFGSPNGYCGFTIQAALLTAHKT